MLQCLCEVEKGRQQRLTGIANRKAELLCALYVVLLVGCALTHAPESTLQKKPLVWVRSKIVVATNRQTRAVPCQLHDHIDPRLSGVRVYLRL